MKRGGRRRRWIAPGEAAVYCAAGRWGRRRTRVTECWSVFRAEELYTALLKDNAASVRPGGQGSVRYTVEGREVTASWEIRPNAVWRRGRVFLQCPRCSRRATRLYLPLADSWLACRTCWGLSYNSRALQNYKNSLWGRGPIARMFGTSQRDWALLATYDKRREQLERSRNRWSERRDLLARKRARTRD